MMASKHAALNVLMKIEKKGDQNHYVLFEYKMRIGKSAFLTRVSFAWSVITHDRSKDKFRVINQFHITDHLIKTQIIGTIFVFLLHYR